MKTRPIRFQPLNALAGWFTALKEAGPNCEFLVLHIEQADDDCFVQVVYDCDGFLIDHPLYTKGQKARKALVLRIFREQEAERYNSGSETLMARLGVEIDLAAAKAGRIIRGIFGAGRNLTLSIAACEFPTAPDDSEQEDDESSVESEIMNVSSPEELAEVFARITADIMEQAGYSADFSMASLEDVDRLFDEHCEDGQPIPNGYFDPAHVADGANTRVFGLGCYVGEVLCRAYGGKWFAESRDLSQAPDSLCVRLPGSTAYPISKVVKRFENGSEDGIATFGIVVGMLGEGNDKRRRE